MDDDSITTDRLILRRWVSSDTAPLIAMCQDEEVMRYFPSLLSEGESLDLLERIAAHFEKKNYGLFAVAEKDSGKFLGFTGFATPRFEADFTPCIEIGWRLQSDAWGNGIATEAALACLRYGFETLHFDKVVSFTSLLNKSSERVMQKIGMTFIKHFQHPGIDRDHALCPHVLYEITKENYRMQMS